MTKDNVYGKCKLCEKEDELCKSHAIPDSLFRKLFAKDSGKAIKLSDDDFVQYTNESGWDYQLCRKCEAHLNFSYDKNAIKYLTHTEFQVSALCGVVLRKIDVASIRMFYLSVLWRAVNSNNTIYAKIKNSVDFALNEKLRNSLLLGVCFPERECMVSLQFLFDPDRVLDKNSFATLICTPFIFDGCVCFVFAGYLCKIKFGDFLSSSRRKFGALSTGQSIMVGRVSFLDIPPLLVNIHKNVVKHKLGHTRVKVD